MCKTFGQNVVYSSVSTISFFATCRGKQSPSQSHVVREQLQTEATILLHSLHLPRRCLGRPCGHIKALSRSLHRLTYIRWWRDASGAGSEAFLRRWTCSEAVWMSLSTNKLHFYRRICSQHANWAFWSAATFVYISTITWPKNENLLKMFLIVNCSITRVPTPKTLLVEMYHRTHKVRSSRRLLPTTGACTHCWSSIGR